jgi:hypothetical protein
MTYRTEQLIAWLILLTATALLALVAFVPPRADRVGTTIAVDCDPCDLAPVD